jgi:carbon-monoxide dehydrogenase large subunit
MEWDVRGAFTADGTLLGFDVTLTTDIGAYIRTIGPWLALYAAEAFVGPYRVPHYHCHVRCVVTNKMGVGTVRSPGGYEATFARERIIDIAAHELAIDRVELRRRNLLRPGELPADTQVPVDEDTPLHGSGNHEATLDAVLDALEARGIEELRKEARGRGRSLGIGVACCTEAAYTGESEAARVRREPTGAITVFTSTAAMGQGHWTALAQIAADALGADPESVTVVEGDTTVVPEGAGTFGSRTTIMAGNAVWLAARELRSRIDDRSVDPDRPCEVTREFRTDATCVSHAASVAVVEVDTELGQVFLQRYVVAADVGSVINPLLVHGQIAGAAVQGIGGALLEELAYSNEAQPLSTTFEQYLLPTALDVPTVEVILMDSTAAEPGNPLGVRGAGEIGTPGAGAALANAVADALGSAASVTSLPLKPGVLTARAGCLSEE